MRGLTDLLSSGRVCVFECVCVLMCVCSIQVDESSYRRLVEHLQKYFVLLPH